MTMPATDAPATDAPQTDSTPATGTQPAVTPSATDSTDWQAEAEKWKRLSRQNEDRAKGNVDEITRQGQALALVAEKLGLDLDGKPDADKLAAELDKANRTARQRTSELAVYRAAAAAGADADALLDSRSFMAQVDELDPSSGDYSARVAEAAKAWADAHPKPQAEPARDDSKPRPPASRSGADFGAPAPSRQWTQAQLEAASPEALEKAMAEGLLTDLGIGKTKPGRYRRT
jgi:hypothetical protein